MSAAIRKSPRDFVHVDEFWPADDDWSEYFISVQPVPHPLDARSGEKISSPADLYSPQGLVWVFADEYRAELDGDEDYSRIVIHAGADSGWLWSRPLSERAVTKSVLESIEQPVACSQLAALGFVRWAGSYI